MLKKLFTLLTALVLCSSMSWGTDYSFSYSTFNDNNKYGYIGTGNTAPVYCYDWGNDFIVYFTFNTSNAGTYTKGGVSYVMPAKGAYVVNASSTFSGRAGNISNYNSGWAGYSNTYSQFNKSYRFDAGNFTVEEGADGPYIYSTNWVCRNVNNSQRVGYFGCYIGTAATYYTVTVNSSDNTKGTASYAYKSGYVYANSRSKEFKKNSVYTITATPKSGYRFVQWSDGDTNESRDITITGNATYTATFEQLSGTQYTVSAGVDASCTGMGSVTSSPATLGQLYENTNVTLTANPTSLAYAFVKWQKGGEDFAGNTANPLKFAVSGDAAYTAVFEHLPKGTITIVSNYGTVTGGGSYERGTQVQLSVTPNTDYRFVQWSDGNTDNPRTITVTGDATYTAQYADKSVPLIASFSWDDDDISVEKYGDGDGLCTSFYSPASMQFHLLYADAQKNRSTNNYLQLSIKSSASYDWGGVSWVSPGTYPVSKSGLTTGWCDDGIYWYWTESENNVCIAYNYDSYDLGLNPLGSWVSEISGETQSNYLSVVEGMTAIVEVGKDGNPYIRLIRNSDEQVMVAVGEKAAAKVNITFKVEGQDDKVVATTPGEVPSYGASDPTKASTAQYEYTFTGWSPDLVAATEEATYTAQFDSVVRQYTITIDTPENGTITVMNGETPVSNGAQVEYGTVLTVTATPTNAEDYKFGEWTNDGAASVTVDGNKTIGATFVEIPKAWVTLEEVAYYYKEKLDDASSTAIVTGVMSVTDGTTTYTYKEGEENTFEFPVGTKLTFTIEATKQAYDYAEFYDEDENILNVGKTWTVTLGEDDMDVYGWCGVGSVTWEDKAPEGYENYMAYYKAMMDTYADKPIRRLYLGRTFAAKTWGTLCVPIRSTNLGSSSMYKLIYGLKEAYTNESKSTSTVTVSFVVAEVLEAGKPYMFIANQEAKNPFFNYIMLDASAEAQRESGTNVDFVGVLNENVLLGAGDRSVRYVAGNKMYYPNSKGSGVTMTPDRAYFEITDFNTQQAPMRVRLMVEDEIIEDVMEDEVEVTKYIENGNLIIERNNVRYSATGAVVD